MQLETYFEWSKVLTNYLETHIKQRFLLLNYFIIIFSFLVIAAYFSHNICHSKMTQGISLLILGLIMSLMAIIFYFFEYRLKFLIDRCHTKLGFLEKKVDLDSELRLYESERNETDKKKEGMKKFYIPFGYLFSCSKCINLLIVISWVSYVILLFLIYFSNIGSCYPIR
jgi:hypothetical protein